MQLDASKLRQRITRLFEENFQKFGDLGAAVSIWQNGKALVDLYGGFKDARRQEPWTDDTLVLIWSATKGLGSACVLHVLQEHKIDIERRVTEFLPEFAQGGKKNITLAQLLSHQAGLAALDRKVGVLDYPGVIAALEKQRPLWPPGTAHAYHARTFGYLLDELVRRIAGQSLSEYWRKTFADPLNLDLWIGLPEAMESRVATMLPAPAPAAGTPLDIFTARLLDPSTLLHRAFVNPPLPAPVFNERAFHAAEIPAANGITNARSLARMYAACIGEVDGVRLLQRNTVDAATRVQSAGEDLVLGYETRYATGFQLSFPFRPMAGEGSFGHYGMGGSAGFADPGRRIAFAYVMNQMLPSGGVDPRTKSLVDALLGCL